MTRQNGSLAAALLVTAVSTWFGAAAAHAQAPPLNESCIVSVLNRNVRVKADGTWILPNIPANFGLVRARATCVVNGQTISGESAPFLIAANNSVDVPPIVLGATTPIPQSLTLTGPTSPLGQVGANATVAVAARFADGTTRDVTQASTGTRYVISNAAIAAITADGVVTALASGTVLIQATHEGTSGFTAVRVVLSADSDADGIPDDLEIALGLNPNNAADAFEDLDRDGASNRDEALAGTNLRDADSDDDTLLDGEELRPGADGFITNPLSADTDGDGVRDALEVSSGSHPSDASSVNLAQALQSLTVAPTSFTITVNSVVGVGSLQLTVTGTLRDGTTINLTSTARGTNYASSDLGVCNFGAPDGRVFGSSNGVCTVTVTNAGFTAAATGTVTNFTPTALSSISIPGYANNVDVNGGVAYVAAGASGLVVVNVAAPTSPTIVATLDTPGNANDVRVIGNRVYIADGSAGLHIVDVTNPSSPAALGFYDTPGEANDVMVSGNFAYVADGASGVHIIDISIPSTPQLVRTIDTPGTARGVDVEGTTLVVADDAPSPALRVIDVTTPASASIVGSTSILGTAIDVDLVNGFAYVAAYTSGVAIVDVRTPGAPAIVGTIPGSSPNGFVPRDVQVAGQFALFAEQLFANAVAPIVDVSDPTQPFFRGVLDFGQDYAGTGIALSGPYVYWTGQSFVVSAENGTTGTTRLFIGQYISIEDRSGVPPAVTIVQPTAGASVVEGSQLAVRADATDDVAVASVTFTVNGAAAYTDTSEPFEARLSVPPAPGPMVLGATAADFGGNSATAGTVAVNVIPDPLTTVVGRVLTRDGAPVNGASVTLLTFTTTTAADGTFTIANVPTVQGNLIVRASAPIDGRTARGGSNPTPPTPAGITNVGDIRLRGGRVLFVFADHTSETARANIAAAGIISLEDIDSFDARLGTPTLAQLSEYAAVLAWSDFMYLDPVALGDVLADFVDQGGGVVTATFSHYPGYALQGRIASQGYIGFAPGGGAGSNTLSLANSDTSHPILQGVTSANLSFGYTDYSGHTLTPGSIVIARDTVNAPKVVASPSGRVVSIAIFPGFGLSTDLSRLFANAIDFVR